MARCGSRSCCSFRSMAILAAIAAVFVTIVNPVLDRLIAPPLGDELAPEMKAKQLNPPIPFDPSRTDLLGYKGMNFPKRGEQPEIYIGLAFIMQQSFPRWMTALANKFDPSGFADADGGSYNPMEVDIWDARKNPGTFAERGFTLLDMGDTPSANGDQSWRSPAVTQAFQKDLEPRILELYPKATRVDFTYHVIRGGSGFLDQPAAINGPHLDYTQNDTARRAFHEDHPPWEGSEPAYLLGNRDTETEELGVLLGIWKPTMMKTPVCDHPLAVMDASTFRPDRDETPMALHLNFFGFRFHNLNGALHYHEDQRWYYYPFQKDTEVLVFTHYSRHRGFANPHGSFQNPNCPEDSDKRVSVEMRAAVFFPREQSRAAAKN